jgi:dipeptidyl aminopeptidase/acylaminoacyl peptidase
VRDESLITPEDFNDIVSVQDPQVSPDGAWIAFVRLSVDRLENEYRRAIWLAPTSGALPKPFTTGTKQDYAPRWSLDGKHLAFISTRGGDKPQIYIIPTDGGEARQLTDMRQGTANLAWSPDGGFIAFTSRVNAEEREKEDNGSEDEGSEAPPRDAFEAKQRREAEEHQEKDRFDPRVIRRQPYRASTDYLDDRRTHIYVIAAAAGAGPDAVDPDGVASRSAEKDKRPRRLTDGDVDYGPPAWSPDGTSLLTAATRDPESDTGWIYQDVFRVPVPPPDAPRGEPVSLTEPGFCNFAPKPSPDGSFVAYLRQPEERIFAQAPRLVVIPGDGGQPQEVAPDFDRGVESFCWSPDGRNLVFTAGDEGDTGLYTVQVEGGLPVTVVSGRRDVVAFDVAHDEGQIGFVACTPERPPDLYTVRSDGGGERRLTDFNGGFLEKKRVMPVEGIWYTASDGVEIQGWLIKPPGFDPTKTYPLAVEIHGGPHAMWGPSTMTMWHEWQCLAAQGYVVFYCNPRGSDGYGYAFRDAIHARWGESDMPDILAGVDHVVSQGYIDAARMVVTGGSYGGFMTAWIVGHDQRFAAAVSQRGVYHLTNFFGTSDIPELIEGEFDAWPWEAYERLWQHSPLAYVNEIKTPLLIIHSEQDFRVPIPDAEHLFLMLRWLKREVEFVRYPREGHELSRSGEPRHRVDRLKRIIDWFDRYCGKDGNGRNDE